MKKIIIISVIFIIILLVAIVGSILVSPKDKIKEEVALMEFQKELDDNYVCYGYTIDNPRIVVNPFGNSVLSALIMFETEDAERVSVYLYNDNKYLLYEENEASRCHYLDIYNLLSGNNKVLLMYDDKEYIYNIKTEDVKVDLPNVNISSNDIYFTNIDSSLVGFNSNKQIIAYLNGFVGNVIQLENGHLLVAVNRYNNDGSYISFAEIDMLGKIYNEYVLSDGYYGLACQLENGNYLVLSDDIIEVDRQNGDIINQFEINEDDDWISLSYINGKIELKGLNKSIYINYNDMKQEVVFGENKKNDNILKLENGNYYKKFKQNRFGSNSITDTSSEKVNMLFYSKKDENYEQYEINFLKEYDRIVVSKEKNEKIYIILDKFGKRLVYEMTDNIFYINTVNLSGKFNIFIKIGNKVYKSDYYVEI